MKQLKLVGVVLLVVGLLIGVVGPILVKKAEVKEEDRVYTTATITRIEVYGMDDDETHDVYVEYRVGGEKIENELNYYTSSMREGDTIEIYYDKNNVNRIGSKGGDNLFILFPILGGIAAIIGLGLIISPLLSNQKKQKLMKTGQEVVATIRNINMNNSVVVNGKNPYILECSWVNPSDNLEYTFKSEYLWDDPRNKIMNQNITECRVYINPNNLKEYAVDTSFLEK